LRHGEPVAPPALAAAGDAGDVSRLLRRIDGRGTGADRRRELSTATTATIDFTEALARATVDADRGFRHPGRAGRP
jgi:hypothetical protein